MKNRIRRISQEKSYFRVAGQVLKMSCIFGDLSCKMYPAARAFHVTKKLALQHLRSHQQLQVNNYILV